jgi:magnesium-protoporphyrin O-methyltransferase
MLARDGAGPVTGIDLSPASLDIARSRAAAAGLPADDVSFQLADASSVALEPRDWVILDRVICCYDDMPRLLSNALSATPSRIAFAVPDSRGWRGLAFTFALRAERVWNRLARRDNCPGFVHGLDAIDRVLVKAGLSKTRETGRGLWYAAVYERGPV